MESDIIFEGAYGDIEAYMETFGPGVERSNIRRLVGRVASSACGVFTRAASEMGGTLRTEGAAMQASHPTSRVRDAEVAMGACSEPIVRRSPGGFGRTVQD